MTRAPGWLPDPTRRHELRYWDGGVWTSDVADGGTEAFDPGPVPVTPPPDDLVAPAPTEGRAGPPSPGGDAPADPAFDPASGIPAPQPLPPPPGRARRALPFVVALLVVAAGVAVVLLVISGGSDDEDDPSNVASATTEAPDGSGGSTSSPGSNGGSDQTEAMVDAIVTGIVEQTGGVITEDEAECMAEQLLDEVGAERLEEVGDAVAGGEGLNPLGLLTEEEQAAALSRMRTCVDLTKLGELAPDGE